MKEKLILFTLFALAACTSPTAQENTFQFTPASLDSRQAAFTARMTIATPDMQGLSLEAQRSRLSAAYRVSGFWDVYSQLETAENMDRKEEIARALLAETPDEGRWLVEQQVAQYMLEKLLSTEDTAEPDRVGYYVELLHRNDSQRADLLVGSLTRLRGTWPSEKVQSYAASGVEQAEHWLERVGQARSAKTTPESLPPQHTNTDRVAHYLGQLEALAAN